MNISVTIDEKIVAMAAFVKIVKKYYKDKGFNRDPKAVKKFMTALSNPEHFCRMDIDPEKVYEDYTKLDMGIETNDRVLDAVHGIDSEQLCRDILTAYNTIEQIDDMPSIYAGRYLDMVFDKTIGNYKEGLENFAIDKDDRYFMNVLSNEQKIG